MTLFRFTFVVCGFWVSSSCGHTCIAETSLYILKLIFSAHILLEASCPVSHFHKYIFFFAAMSSDYFHKWSPSCSLEQKLLSPAAEPGLDPETQQPEWRSETDGFPNPGFCTHWAGLFTWEPLWWNSKICCTHLMLRCERYVRDHGVHL